MPKLTPLWTERPTLDVDVGLPLEERFRNAPPAATAAARELLDAVVERIPSMAWPLAYAVHLRTGNRFRAECAAIARAANYDWQRLTLANCSYDQLLATLDHSTAVGCSTLALPTASGPVLARNMDWWPEDLLARATYRIRAVRDGRAIWAMAGWPGAFGVVTGLSVTGGFGVALNAVLSPSEPRNLLGGQPVMLLLRQVLEDAVDFTAAVETLSRTPLLVPALFTVVGRTNEQRVVIERTPTRHAHRWGRPGRALITTNDYRALDADTPPSTRSPSVADNPVYGTASSRYLRLSRLTESWSADAEPEDHELLDPLFDRGVRQSITSQQVLIRPARGDLRVYVPTDLLGGV